MMATFESKYDIADEVTVIPIDVKGFVDAIRFDSNDVSYAIVYWYNGSRNYTWCSERELKQEVKCR
jgi:hypothetical protein